MVLQMKITVDKYYDTREYARHCFLPWQFFPFKRFSSIVGTTNACEFEEYVAGKKRTNYWN